ncbi:pentatricopeptide repeat-containing protein At5g15340, mitochondrial-like [Elaeis guineensis]|uniref:pentatricopeptide repeat-containing protein At5g15340, mitochondrial-like n=1 Tax=Elaeis guineensis var. tenera TaxID=51953 RepID=UPI003C6D7B9C
MPDSRHLFDEMHCPTVVSWTVLLSSVLRLEGLANGREVFERMPQKNEVSGTVMVAYCIEAGLSREALSLLSQMLFLDISVRNLNHMSFCSLLSACSQVGDLTVGRWIHAHFTKTGPFSDGHLLMVRTGLVDMYAKCGRIDTACRLFKIMPCRNLVACDAGWALNAWNGC